MDWRGVVDAVGITLVSKARGIDETSLSSPRPVGLRDVKTGACEGGSCCCCPALLDFSSHAARVL